MSSKLGPSVQVVAATTLPHMTSIALSHCSVSQVVVESAHDKHDSCSVKMVCCDMAHTPAAAAIGKQLFPPVVGMSTSHTSQTFILVMGKYIAHGHQRLFSVISSNKGSLILGQAGCSTATDRQPELLLTCLRTAVLGYVKASGPQLPGYFSNPQSIRCTAGCTTALLRYCTLALLHYKLCAGCLHRGQYA